jgi:hypothetical protein
VPLCCGSDRIDSWNRRKDSTARGRPRRQPWRTCAELLEQANISHSGHSMHMRSNAVGPLRGSGLHLGRPRCSHKVGAPSLCGRLSTSRQAGAGTCDGSQRYVTANQRPSTRTALADRFAPLPEAPASGDSDSRRINSFLGLPCPTLNKLVSRWRSSTGSMAASRNSRS